MQDVGGELLRLCLEALDEPYPPKEVPCPCGGQAPYRFRRSARLLSVFGRISYRRAYYSCPQCHRGFCPLDQKLELQPGEVSVALGSLLALLGVQTAFEEVLLVRVSENTVRKETQSYGQLQMQEEARWHKESHDEERLQERLRSIPDPPKRLYGSLDGVIVPVGQEWRELKVGCWYEVEGDLQGTLKAKEISYYCNIKEARHF